MRSKMLTLSVVAFVALSCATAHAQQSVTNPYPNMPKLPTYVTHDGGGGYYIGQPGQFPARALPDGTGGYVIDPPPPPYEPPTGAIDPNDNDEDDEP